MNYRRLSLLLGVLAGASPVVTAPALADNPHSINHVITNGLPKTDCMRRGGDILRLVGLRTFGTTSDAVWAVTTNEVQMASTYCLPTRDIVVITVSGPSRQDNHNLVDRIVEAWRRVQ